MSGKCTRVVLNISGEIFETRKETLNRFPQTLLGQKRKRDVHYCPDRNQYFFNRNRSCFDAILYFYQSKGILHCPDGILVSIFQIECQFFELPEESITKMMEREGFLLPSEDSNEINHEDMTIQLKILNLLNPITSN